MVSVHHSTNNFEWNIPLNNSLIISDALHLILQTGSTGRKPTSLTPQKQTSNHWPTVNSSSSRAAGRVSLMARVRIYFRQHWPQWLTRFKLGGACASAEGHPLVHRSLVDRPSASSCGIRIVCWVRFMFFFVCCWLLLATRDRLLVF